MKLNQIYHIKYLYKLHLIYNIQTSIMIPQKSVKRKLLTKQSTEDSYPMSPHNIKICLDNQNRYQTPQLNDALELQYYSFGNIANLGEFTNLNTLYLNNNQIAKIENLGHLTQLVTLNLSNNRIQIIQNIQNLKSLKILDLSHNKIEGTLGMQTLIKLQTLNLSHNLLKNGKSIKSLEHNLELLSINFSNNPLEEDLSIHELLALLPNLKLLYLKDTPFMRGLKNYRRETICKLKELTFLDERPVTKNQRMLAEAWKEGGLMKQKQVKRTIQEDRDEKNRKIYEQMVQRSSKVEVKRDKLFEQLTQKEQNQLNEYLKMLKQLQDNQENSIQIQTLTLAIAELELYLVAFREDVNDMNVEDKKQVPDSLNTYQDQNAIYVYFVKDEDLPKIKERYFPQETKPLIATDFPCKQQSRWIVDYENIFIAVKDEYGNKPWMIIHEFNLRVHKFDQEYRRKSRRFTKEQLIQILGIIAEIDDGQKSSQVTLKGNELDELD